MDIHISMSSRSFLALIFAIALSGAGLVAAYGTNNAQFFGHSGGEVDVVCPTDGSTVDLETCLSRINAGSSSSSRGNTGKIPIYKIANGCTTEFALSLYQSTINNKMYVTNPFEGLADATFKSTCLSTTCNSYAGYKKCDGSCGETSRQTCDNELIGYMDAP